MAQHIKHEDIQASLRAEPVQGKHLLHSFRLFLESIGAEDCPIKILEDSFVNPDQNKPEVHDHEEDIWLCLEGAPVFVCGGELVNPKNTKPNEWVGDSIRGGEEIMLHPGDFLRIEAREPHQHFCPEGTARMVIIKRAAAK